MEKAIGLGQLKHVKYWREEEGRLAVESWRSSGMTAGAFAAKHGLTTRRVLWWRWRLGRDVKRPSVVATALVPVDIIGAAVAAPTATIEVLLRCGRVVRVGVDVDAAALARVVLALESLC